MRIRYQPLNGQLRRTIPYFPPGAPTDADGNPTGAAFRDWAAGDERDVPDDLQIDFNVSNNSMVTRGGKIVAQGQGSIRKVKAVDALLSAGPDFVDTNTGQNPDFTCSACGEYTASEYFHDPNADVAWNPSKTPLDNPDTRVWYTTTRTVDGDRLCIRDFLARNTHFIPLHAGAGFDPEQIEAARKLATEAEAKTRANAAARAGTEGAEEPSNA